MEELNQRFKSQYRFFEVKEEHCKLLKHLKIVNVGWLASSWGAPSVDEKQPYGDSFIEGSVGEILGVEPSEEEEYSEEQIDYFMKLHDQTRTVLQITVQNNGVHPGTYVATFYGDNWHPIPETIDWGLFRKNIFRKLKKINSRDNSLIPIAFRGEAIYSGPPFF